MFKFKIILIGAIISSIATNSWALDLQSKFRNTDRSLLETISDYQTIEPGRFYFSNTASLISNPLVEAKSGRILVDSMKDMEFSAVGSFYKNWEIGISVPYFQTTAAPGSRLNGYTGMGDIYIENKFNLFDQLSIVPVYIKQSSEGLTGTGSAEGGYGLKVVGSFWEKSLVPFYYSVGYYSLPNTTYGTVDQSQRIQASLGALYRLTKEIVAGSEFYIDQATNRSSKELLAHLTVHFDSFSLRAGAGSGFLNEDKLNDLRVFASLMFDLDFRKKESVTISKVESKPVTEVPVETEIKEEVVTISVSGDTVDVFSEPISPEEKKELEERREETQKTLEQIEIDKKLKELEEIQKSLNKQVQFDIVPTAVVSSTTAIDPKLLTDNSLVSNVDTSEDDYTVIPAFTVKDLKELKKQQDATPETKFSEVLPEKNKRLQDAQQNLGFWIYEYEGNRLTLNKAQKEITWGLRVVERRRNTLKDLYKTNKEEMDALPEGRYFQKISDFEKKAIAILKIKNKEPAKPVDLIENLNIQKDSVASTVEVITIEETKKEIIKEDPVAPKKLEQTPPLENKDKLDPVLRSEKELAADKEKIRVTVLEAEQKKLWELSKTQTLSDVLSSKRKNKSSSTIKIKTPKTTEELLPLENTKPAEAPITESSVPVAAKPEVKEELKTEIKSEELTGNGNQPQISSETVILTESTVSPVVASPEAKELAPESKKESPEAQVSKVIIVPDIQSLVSETVELKNTTNTSSDTLDKVNLLLEQRKKEEEAESKYKSLIQYYEDELSKIKKKIEAEKAKDERPLKQVEIKIENKTKTQFNEDGTIEIKQFKLNSIQERYQEEQIKNEAISPPSEPQNRQYSGGLVEDGELEISDGPIY